MLIVFCSGCASRSDNGLLSPCLGLVDPCDDDTCTINPDELF